MPTTVAPVSERPSGACSPSSTDSRLEIAATRTRQTDKPPAPFRDVLAGGVALLMSGAEVATHVVAGPVMAAAVHDARIGAVSSVSGGSGGFGSPGVGPSLEGAGSGMGGLVPAGPGAGTPGTPASVQALMQDGQSSNMQMLALQQQIQEESQRFTTVSNVMRAKYDTAKAAVSNIRA
jgi:NAD(P)-dependent dehydrogenase (short-subunit alcohol dehydrogenase family)